MTVRVKAVLHETRLNPCACTARMHATAAHQFPLLQVVEGRQRRRYVQDVLAAGCRIGPPGIRTQIRLGKCEGVLRRLRASSLMTVGPTRVGQATVRDGVKAWVKADESQGMPAIPLKAVS